jgi:hypothetical protein
MKNILFIAILSSILFASSNSMTKQDRINKQIELEMKKETQYSIEQTFYQGLEYDLSSSEVNPDSLDSIPDLEIQDLDMDSIYD